jgi:FkbM family methyltransferase
LPNVISYLYEASVPVPRHTVWSRVHQRLCALALRLVTRFADPVIRTRIGRRLLHAPASHREPWFRARHPYYDTALPRLAAFIHRKQGYLTFVDVGANIGDTLCLVTDGTPAWCLAIEGDEASFRLLLLNTAPLENVVCERVVVSDAEGTLEGDFVRARGTAHIARHDARTGRPLVTTTVDRLVEKHPAFARTNLLKVDTDGYDYKVIRGAGELLRAARPAIYFELSPWHLRTVGGEEPLSVFGLLESLGYRRALLYDNQGYPLAGVDTADQALLAQLLNYASLKRHFYFDVLALHATYAADFDEFVRAELEVIPRFAWQAPGPDPRTD